MKEQPVVLYVEDDRLSRIVMSMLLKNHLQLEHVYMFEDSEDFMKRVAEIHPKPDLIFLDIHLTPHNGFEMLTMLRESGQYDGVSVIALTASVMSEEVEQLTTAGFNGCIAKPIDGERFPQLFNSLLQGKDIWHIVS